MIFKFPLTSLLGLLNLADVNFAFQPISVRPLRAHQVHRSQQSPTLLHFSTGNDQRFHQHELNANSLKKNVLKTRKSDSSPKSSTTLNALLNTAVLSASLSATAKLLSSITIGALTTPAGPKKFGNILDASAVSALSRLTYWLFQPCFLLTGVASTLAKATSGTGGLPTSALMLLPLAALVQISLGAIAAKMLTTKKFGIRPKFLGIDTDDDAGANGSCYG